MYSCILITIQIGYHLMNCEIKRTKRDGGVIRQFYDSDGQLIKVVRPKEYVWATLSIYRAAKKAYHNGYTLCAIAGNCIFEQFHVSKYQCQICLL